MAATMEDSAVPVAALVRTPGAPPVLPEVVPFSSQNAAISIGRAETNNIVLNDRKISKVHARMQLRTCKRKGSDEVMRRLFIRDSSTFGAFVNGVACAKEQWVMLEEGDVIGLRNPHGNASLGEYRVRYPDAGGGLARDDVGDSLAWEGHLAVPKVGGTKPETGVQQPLGVAGAPAALRPGEQPMGAAEELSPLEEDGGHGGAATRGADVGSPVSPAGNENVAPSAAPQPSMASCEPTMEMYAEPLSPLSEVSEVSAPDENPQQQAPLRLLSHPGIQQLRPPLLAPVMVPPRLNFGTSVASLLQGSVSPTSVGLVPYMLGSALGGNTSVSAMQSVTSKASSIVTPISAPAPAVLTVQADLVGMLIGKGGETVKQLSKDSGARIEISKTGQEGPNGERTVYISGPQDCIDKAKHMIEDTLGKARERFGTASPNTHVMKVQHELVGMLIGKGGETIKELKKESGARIDISKEPAETNSNDRLVHLSGPPECVEFARKMIDQMLGRARERTGETGLAIQDTTPIQVPIQVPHELIGMLIGKGGETIKGISKDSGARIEICKEEKADSDNNRTVFLYGTTDCIDKAKQMIDVTLGRSRERQADDKYRGRSRSRSRSRGRRSRSRSGRRGGGGPKVIQVPPELVGMLIGKGGETIKAISRDTGARIEISKDDRDSDRTVTIAGSEENIQRAQDAIDEVLSKGRDRDGRRGDDDHDGLALALTGRRMGSPNREGLLCEKVYVDECDMPFRPNFLGEHEDGLLTDLEIFIRGFSTRCAERDLWEYLYRLGATDVKEILLLRRQKQSKGMAYVVFNRHDHAVIAKQKLQGLPAAAIPIGGQLCPEEKGVLMTRFSESERCINGRSNVYGIDMVGLLLGTKGKCMLDVKEESGLRKVLLTGRNMKSFGQVDEDPRLHMVVYYDVDEVENVMKAIRTWGDQLGGVHREIVEKAGKGKGFMMKGKGKGWHEWAPMDHWGPPPPHVDFLRPPPMMPLPPALEVPVEAPVLLQRRRFPRSGDAGTPGPKVVEATALRGRELRWQPWPEVSKFNEEWHVLPMRWGLRGELFVLLRKKETGETRVCAAEVHLPVEKWPVLSSNTGGGTPSPSVRFKAFTFNEHLFLISLDRGTGKLTVFHVPDPGSQWGMAFETILPEEAPQENGEDCKFSRHAKLCVFYSPDRVPHVITKDLKAGFTRTFRIVDPGKAWVRCPVAPSLSPKARLLPVYTKAKSNNPSDFEVSIFAVDPVANELVVHTVPAESKPWMQVSSLPFPGDTRLSCIYVPGKPEPLLMAGSPTERMQKLCHLNLLEWCAASRDDRAPPPKAAVVEEKFSRPMASLWPGESRGGDDPALIVALPMDCTADLPVSRHAWVSTPLGLGGEMMPVGVPPLHGGPPDMRPPFDRMPYPFASHVPPCFDPRGPPPFNFPHPAFGRPPFDGPPFDGKGKGKGFDGKGFDAMRPPFDMPPPGGVGSMPPPPHFEGPPPPGAAGEPRGYARPPPMPFNDPLRPPPFDHEKGKGKGGPSPDMLRPPFDGFLHGRPPFDGPPGRPPFDAPPGEWFGGQGPRPPPFDVAGRPQGPPTGPPPPGGPPLVGGPGTCGDRACGGGDGKWPDVGSVVEANFRDRNWWSRATVVNKHEGGFFDVQYDGDYIEWQVPLSRLRPLPALPGISGEPVAPGEGPQQEGADRERRHRRHRHRRRGDDDAPAAATGGGDGEGGGGAPPAESGVGVSGGAEHRHRKRRRSPRATSADDGAPGAPPSADGAAAAAEGGKGEGGAVDGAGGGSGGAEQVDAAGPPATTTREDGERRRHRHRRHHRDSDHSQKVPHPPPPQQDQQQEQQASQQQLNDVDRPTEAALAAAAEKVEGPSGQDCTENRADDVEKKPDGERRHHRRRRHRSKERVQGDETQIGLTPAETAPTSDAPPA
eukprot:TRINITY_DN17534_c0_g1_i1.p1 TRINITY_DN17534_c0_g1~~TRINITY_DN17534_c0_g1_i1.p1  ORF type:complete len:1908 (-),score=371.19 TRINITY_DN17534_c0_g1_i1:105-5828(-)